MSRPTPMPPGTSWGEDGGQVVTITRVRHDPRYGYLRYDVRVEERGKPPSQCVRFDIDHEHIARRYGRAPELP